jgi:hypothetical protein
MPHDPHQQSVAGRIGAYVSWSHTADRSARTEAARKAFRDRFESQVPADVTDPGTRVKAAESARRAHFLRMAARSAAVRRARRAA